MNDVIVAVADTSTSQLDRASFCSSNENSDEEDDERLGDDDIHDVTTCEHAPPPLPPRRCVSRHRTSARRLPPESPPLPPPIPPRAPLTQVVPSSTQQLDEHLGDVWIYRDEPLGRRLPPFPLPRRPVSGYATTSTSSTNPVEHRCSEEVKMIPELLPRSTQPRRQLVPESRPPPPPPMVPPSSSSFVHGVVIGQLVDGTDFNADEFRMVTKAWRCPCCARASTSNVVGDRSCQGGSNNDVISLTSQRRHCLLSQTTVAPVGLRATPNANSRIVQLPVITNAGVSSINSINAARRRVANEYVDDPMTSSALTSAGLPRKQQRERTSGIRTPRRQRFILFVSAPALTSAETSDAPLMTGSRILRTTNVAHPADNGGHRVMMTSPTVCSSAIEVIEFTPTDEDDKAEVDSCDDSGDHQRCSSVCCGRPRRSRSIDGERRGGTGGGSSLIAALCLPGMWLVRHAKATYRRRNHAAATPTSAGDKRNIEASNELNENLSRTINIMHDSSVT